MTTIVTRVGKGSPLTWTEVDTNFTNLNSAKYESGNNATLGTIQGSTITATTAFSGALNGSVGATTPAAGTFTSLSDSGNLTFTGTGNRIRGDFTATTNSVQFQTSVSNSPTYVSAVSNGTNTFSGFLAWNDNSASTSAAWGGFYVNGGGSPAFNIVTDKNASGTYMPMRFLTGGSERMRIDTSGNVGIGTTSPSYLLHLSQNGNTTALISATNSGTNSAGLTLENAGQRNWNIWADRATDTFRIGNNARATTNITIDSSGNVGIGTTSPSSYGGGLAVYNAPITGVRNFGNASWNFAARALGTAQSQEAGYTFFPTFEGTGDNGPRRAADIWSGFNGGNWGTQYLAFGVGNASNDAQDLTPERMRIDASGNVGINSASPGGVLDVRRTGASAGWVIRGQSTTAANESGIYMDGSNNMELAARNGSGTLTARIGSSGISYVTGGDFSVGKSNTDYASAGAYILTTGIGIFTASGDRPLGVNRKANDGTLVSFWQDQVEEGSISVSGTTVSYNGGHLSRWSQWQNQTGQPEVYRGTVLDSTDDMCEWYDDEGNLRSNEQSTKTIVSAILASKAVAGVFDRYDTDDKDNPYDFYVAQSGDFVVRVAAGTVVQNGDLLESAGDGTARVQADDICRSSTIAKVTSNYVSETYADGSFCVPCILMIG